MAIRKHGVSREPSGVVISVPVGDLLLDANNPRLVTVLEAGATQEELLKVLWRNMAVDEIAMSIATSGFHKYEPLFAEKQGKKWVIIEGNRRLAAVRLLRDAGLREMVGATDLPKMSKDHLKGLETLPVIDCTRATVWQWIGFKHVNGPQVWQSYAKAAYIAWVHEEVDESLKDIAVRIGDRHSTVRRLYAGLCVLRQAEDAGLFDTEDRFRPKFAFSHLYTALDYPGVQDYLGVDGEREPKANPIPKNRLPNLKNLMRWLYGSKRDNAAPLVLTQNPDLRRLAESLASPRGVTALERGRGLTSSYELAQGEDKLLRQMVQQAKEGLTRAIGYAVHGFHGEKDLVKDSEAIVDLADRLLEDLSSRSGGRARR